MKKVKTAHLSYLSLIIMLLFLPYIVKGKYDIMLFDQVLINIMVVIGLNFISGLTGQTNLGMAGIFGVGAYTSALLTTRLGLSPWLSLICVVNMGVILGIVLGYPSLRFSGTYLALTTIGFGEIARLLFNNMTDITYGTQGVANIPGYSFFNISISDEKSFYYLLLFFTVMSVLVALRIIKSKWGRAFKAIRDNELAVQSCGINVAEIKIKSFIVSTVYACVAGALYAHLMGYINPSDFTLDLSVKYFMMLVMGGIGTVTGSILGGIVITTLPEYLRFLKDYYWLIFSIIVLICIVLLPNGLVSVFKNPFKKA